MRRVSRSMSSIVAVSSLALVLAACGGGDGEDTTDGGSGSGDGSSSEGADAPEPGGSLIVNGCNPENPLVPSNTAETCGGNVLDVTTAKLIHYNVEDASPEMDIAESIETEDNQNFTVTLKEDYLFSDGTPVTASSFVDAWNYAAFGPNGFQGGYFFEPVDGFADLQCTGEDEDDPCAGAGAPAAEEMTGLEVVDDQTFTIATTSPVSNLPVRLGYTAFAPLPQAFFDDPEGFGDAPISAGPYVVSEFVRNEQIVLERNPDYSGEYPGIADTITFEIYTDEGAAYAETVSGGIDVVDTIPTNVLTDDLWLTDLDGRGITREVGVIQLIGMDPTVDPRLDSPELRTAISMAIDRDTITEQIFAGTNEPATGWVSPVVDGYAADQCGTNCVYDPEAARALWDANGGGDFEGQLTLTYNGDADHGPWTEAVCNSVRDALGVDCVAQPTVDFATFLTDLGDKSVDGLFRQGWQMDYPSIENFLVPLYSADAASNYYSYDNPEFEELTRDAAAAEDLDDANSLYQQAEALLADDMRIIPLWYGTGRVGWADGVEGVALNAFGVPDYANIVPRG